jgi:putative phage-type endonuclease
MVPPFIEIPVIAQGSTFWHEWRRTVIGSSDAPVIMGENKWKSRKRLLEEKSGKREPFKGNELTRQGQILEPQARALYENIKRISVEPSVLQSKARPWQAASVDGICVSSGVVVEIKCGSSAYDYAERFGKVPIYYIGQLQHILSVTGLDTIDFFNFLPGRKPILFEVKRDEDYIARMLAAEQAFGSEMARLGFPLRKTEYSTPLSTAKSSARVGQGAEAENNTPLSIPPPAVVAEAPQVKSQRMQDRASVEAMPLPVRSKASSPSSRQSAPSYHPRSAPYELAKQNDLSATKFPYGARYEGEQPSRRAVWKGVLTWPDGRVYKGEFIRGEMTGHGTLTWLDGRQYEGDFLDGDLTGVGVFSWPDGRRYEGPIVNGSISGTGMFTWADGSRVEATPLPVRSKASSTSSSQPASSYQPRSAPDELAKRNHVSTPKFPYGARYEGEQPSGRAVWKGVLTWLDGRVYKGEFIRGEMTGRGTLTWPDGRQYEGDFLDGDLTGVGVFSWPDGRRYEGPIVNGSISGIGMFTWADGSRFEGSFVKGQPIGVGDLVSPNGERSSGKFVDGQWLSDISVASVDRGISEKALLSDDRSRIGSRSWIRAIFRLFR